MHLAAAPGVFAGRHRGESAGSGCGGEYSMFAPATAVSSPWHCTCCAGETSHCIHGTRCSRCLRLEASYLQGWWRAACLPVESVGLDRLCGGLASMWALPGCDGSCHVRGLACTPTCGKLPGCCTDRACIVHGRATCPAVQARPARATRPRPVQHHLPAYANVITRPRHETARWQQGCTRGGRRPPTLTATRAACSLLHVGCAAQ